MRRYKEFTLLFHYFISCRKNYLNQQRKKSKNYTIVQDRKVTIRTPFPSAAGAFTDFSVLIVFGNLLGKSAEVSKCSTSNEEMTKDTEGTVEIGNSKSSCDQFMASTLRTVK